MSDERDDKKDDPAEEIKLGLGHLWKAARGMATEVKKEVERTDLGKELSGAGREFVRAAANVVDRIADEVSDLAKPRKPGEADHREHREHHEQHEAPAEGSVRSVPPDKVGDGEDDEFDGVKPKPREGGTPADPGFRIAVPDDEKKKP
jgi:hypothetical protein